VGDGRGAAHRRELQHGLGEAEGRGGVGVVEEELVYSSSAAIATGRSHSQ
jgi:hypothetical protein